MRTCRMMDCTEPFIPDSLEVLLLSSGDEVHVPRARPTFKPWTGKVTEDTYENKPLVDTDDEPMFAELAILRYPQKDGCRTGCGWMPSATARTSRTGEQSFPIPVLH